MCLAIPGRVVEWLDQSPLFASAKVDFGGVRRTVNMACVPEAAVQDYVLVHAGIAISRLDPLQAERIWEDLTALGLAHSVDDEAVPEQSAEETDQRARPPEAIDAGESPSSSPPGSASSHSRSLDR